MKNKYTEQEEQLRSLSEDFSIEIDTSEMWDRVEGHLPAEEDRRRPVFWWFLGGLMVLLVGLLMVNISTGSTKSEVENLTVHERPKIAHKNLESNIVETDNTEGRKVTTQLEETRLPLHQEHRQEISSRNTEAQISTTEIQKNNISIVNSDRYDEESTISEEEIDQEKRNILIPASLIDQTSEFETTGQALEVELDRDVVEFQPITTKAIDPLIHNRRPIILPGKVIPVNSVAWRPFFGLHSGLNTHSSTITPQSGDIMDISQFDNEVALLGLTSDVYVGMENSDGWRWSLGLEHSRIVNRFARSVPDTIVTLVPGVVTSKIDDEGNVNHEIGDVKHTTITHYQVRWHRVHDQINLHLNVGKRLVEFGRWKVFGDAVLSRGLWSRHSGYYFEEGSNNIKKFEAVDQHPYASTGFSVGLNLDVEYTFDQFSISLRPFTRMGLGQMTKNTNYYQIKNSQYGVQLGIVYRP